MGPESRLQNRNHERNKYATVPGLTTWQPCSSKCDCSVRSARISCRGESIAQTQCDSIVDFHEKMESSYKMRKPMRTNSHMRYNNSIRNYVHGPTSLDSPNGAALPDARSDPAPRKLASREEEVGINDPAAILSDPAPH